MYILLIVLKVLGLWLLADVLIVALLSLVMQLAKKNPKLVLMFGKTRCLFGLDYSEGLVGVFIGPFAVGVEWGNPLQNFVEPEDIAKLRDNE